jgi:hypothetical protein
MKTGQLRKQNRRLLLTPQGRVARDDPVALWGHLAGNVPPRRTHMRELEPTVLLLTAVAGRSAPVRRRLAGWLEFGYRTSGLRG